MKKIPILTLITLLLVLAATCALAASEPFNCINCGGVGTGSVSSYIAYPTCVKGGTYRLFCSSCKTEYTWSADNVDPNAHNYVYTVVDATCTAAGRQGNRCTLCGNWADDAAVIPATGHKWGGYTYTGTPGQHDRICRNKGCDYKETLSCNYDNYGYRDYRGGVEHGHMCLDCWNWVDHTASGGAATCTEKAACWCGLTYGEVLGHNPGSPVTTPATCTTDGKVETKCTRCQAVLSSETISKTGHLMGGWEYSGTPGTHFDTCRNKGCDYKVTASCNYDNFGYRDYSGGVKHGHMCLDCWNWADHTASGGTATCTEKAVCWCGLSYGDVLGHNPGSPVTTPATCTTDGKVETKCTRCQVVLSTETISKTGHLMGGWQYSGTPGTHVATCRNKDCDYKETASCNYDNFGYRDYSGGVKHGHMCLDCWNWADHTASGGTATCTEKAVCWCGLSYGDALGHNLDNGVTTPATCTAAGKTVKTCQRSGCSYTETTALPMLDHAEGSPVLDPAPTCCNTGLKSWYCTMCSKLLRTETVPALGHNNEGSYKWVTSTKPTCTKEGLEKKVCAHSGTELGETRTVPALGHNLDNGVTTPATCTAAGKIVKTCQRSDCSYTETTALPMLDHVEGSPVLDPAPTCCNAGLKSWYCTMCSKLLRTESVPALGHNSEGSYKWVRVAEPTCTKEGLEKKVCAHSGTELGETRSIPALGHQYVGLWQVGENDSHYRDCYRCGAGRKTVECTYLPLEIDDVMYQVCPVCGRFHNQELEAVTDATITLATGSKPGTSLVRMLAQPFGADETRYPVILTAIFEAEGLIAEPAQNVTGITVSVPMDTVASFKLVYVHVDDVTGQLIWTDVPCTLANGILSFTVEEMGLFLFVAE